MLARALFNSILFLTHAIFSKNVPLSKLQVSVVIPSIKVASLNKLIDKKEG